MEPEHRQIQPQQQPQQSSYMFEKLRESVELLAEHTADQFTYSKYMEFRSNKPIPHNDRFMVEGLIHQIRDVIRRAFKNIFFDLCQKHNVQQLLMDATTEIERAKILHEIEEVSGGLFLQGSDYYFDFMLNVLERLRSTNREVLDG